MFAVAQLTERLAPDGRRPARRRPRAGPRARGRRARRHDRLQPALARVEARADRYSLELQPGRYRFESDPSSRDPPRRMHAVAATSIADRPFARRALARRLAARCHASHAPRSCSGSAEGARPRRARSRRWAPAEGRAGTAPAHSGRFLMPSRVCHLDVVVLHRVDQLAHEARREVDARDDHAGDLLASTSWSTRANVTVNS